MKVNKFFLTCCWLVALANIICGFFWPVGFFYLGVLIAILSVVMLIACYFEKIRNFFVPEEKEEEKAEVKVSVEVIPPENQEEEKP